MQRPNATTSFYLLRGTSSCAFSMIIAYEFVLHTITVGLNPIQLVIVGVVLEMMTIVCEVPTGVVADAYSRKLSINIGTALMGLGFLIEGVWPVFATVLLAQVVWGLGFTFVSGAVTAWITDEVGEVNSRPILLRATQISQVTSLIGIVIATLLASYSIRLPIIVGASLFLLLTLAGVVLIEEKGFQPATVEGNWFVKTFKPFRDGIALVRIRPILRIILILGIVIGIASGSFDRLHTLHFTDNFVFPQLGVLDSVSWFGLLRAIVAVGSLFMTELVRRRNLSNSEAITETMSVIFGGMLLMTLLFVLSGQFWLAAIGYCISQMLRNTSRPLLAIWINRNAVSETRATVISFYWQTNALGQVVGTPPVGWLANQISVRVGLTVGTLIYSLTLPLLWLGKGRGSAETDQATR